MDILFMSNFKKWNKELKIKKRAFTLNKPYIYKINNI